MHPSFRVFSIFTVVCATVLLVRVSPSRAAESAFDFRVDRFEVDMPGSTVRLKGTQSPNYVEEFDDPGLGAWIKQYGTASAADGFLHLTNPGTAVPNGYGVLPGTTLYLSLVGSDRQVADKEGNFVARSYWEPDELAPGDFNHMSLNTLGGSGGMEVAGLAITNMTVPGAPTVYTIVQHLIVFQAGVPAARQLSSVSIDPASITGQIVFELSFDDATNTLTTGFSVDGGATFERPFPPLQIFQVGTWYGYFLLGADPQTGTVRPHPPVPPFCAHGHLGSGGGDIVSGDAVSFEGSITNDWPPFGNYDPRRDGLEVRIVDQVHPEMHILDLTGTAAIPGGRGCGRHDGWRHVLGGFVYRNDIDALPPACIPGSAGGVTRVRLTKRLAELRGTRGTTRFGRSARRGLGYEIDVAGPWRPASGARIATTLVLGDGSNPDTPCATIEAACVVSDGTLTCD